MVKTELKEKFIVTNMYIEKEEIYDISSFRSFENQIKKNTLHLTKAEENKCKNQNRNQKS